MENFNQLSLHPDISKAINARGYTKPTPVQAQSIPIIMQGKDIIASAQTGTGKTAAFVLPALHSLCEQKSSKKVRILILTPTRELASQITKAAGTYGQFLRFNIVSLVGGMPYHHQIRDLARGADIIVATPGRLLDHIDSKRLDLSGVDMLVLDEADRMLDMGFIDDVQAIAKLTPAHRQTLLFSATVDNKLASIVRHLLKNPVRIDLSNEKVAAPQIKQELYKANNIQHKSRLLKHFLVDQNIYKAIIFSATKINADRLAQELRHSGFSAAALHGDLKQNVRNRTIEQLRRGKIQFLVATDVAARGIDISDITHVINYDLPKFCEDYVHRIGRTGRAGKTGIAISFVLPSEIRNLQRIERYVGQRFKLIPHVTINEAAIASHETNSRLTNEHEKSTDQHESSDRRERTGRFDRPHRRRDDRNERTFGGDHQPSDRASKKRFSDDRNERTFNDDRKPSTSRPSRKKFSGDRNERIFNDDRKPGARPLRKKFSDDRSERTSNDNHKPSARSSKKKFSSDRDRFASNNKSADKNTNRPFKKRPANKNKWAGHDGTAKAKS